jgi:hypothetical protein
MSEFYGIPRPPSAADALIAELRSLLAEERAKREQAEAALKLVEPHQDVREAAWDEVAAAEQVPVLEQRIQTLEAALRDIATSDRIGICDSGYSVAAVAHDALAAQPAEPPHVPLVCNRIGPGFGRCQTCGKHLDDPCHVLPSPAEPQEEPKL